MQYIDFFRTAIGISSAPYPYQERLAVRDWPEIVSIPTGMGKTAAIILAWLYKHYTGVPDNPRRLVYCLPMRVLVEQTSKNAAAWIEHLCVAGCFSQSNMPEVHVLMGGDISGTWDSQPEKQQILIGTQDQLLSRALNRGYGMSRFRWPVHFGLLNNDCLWVMDEVQLMGEGLATTAQLQAFRNSMQTMLPARSIWMSATLRPDWLETVDFADAVNTLAILEMSSEDKASDAFKKRVYASKPLAKAPFSASETKNIAAFLTENHQPGTRTLAVVNTVQRAQSLYKEIQALKPDADTVLVHSRFRAQERAGALSRILADPGLAGIIGVATQVVEAGVDVSSATLYTELAPWSSMVQRFGRCNRDGNEKNPSVVWADIDLSKKGAANPYDGNELEESRRQLETIEPDVQPARIPPPGTTPTYQHVIRRKDLIELLDTTPDLAGGDIDVSRFIRDTDDADVQVFWRNLPEGRPAPDEAAPHRDELCRVPVAALKQNRDWALWRWDHLDRQWARIFSSYEIYPGLTLLADAAGGGYSMELGWTGDKKNLPEVLSLSAAPEEGNDDDPYAMAEWTTLADHTDDVVDAVNYFIKNIPVDDAALRDALLLAARWHDAGKAHPVFQSALRNGGQLPSESAIWGKAAIGNIAYERRGFRHELASGIAMLENGMPDLSVYLAMAHHGKVRLSIRSLPHEQNPPEPESRFARGIWDGDILSEADLGGGVTLPETRMDLSYMALGDGHKGPSWLSRAISLRDNPDIGLFRLAFLEAILRVADWRASKERQKSDD